MQNCSLVLRGARLVGIQVTAVTCIQIRVFLSGDSIDVGEKTGYSCFSRRNLASRVRNRRGAALLRRASGAYLRITLQTDRALPTGLSTVNRLTSLY